MGTKVAKIGSHTAPAGTVPRAHPNGVPCFVAYRFFGTDPEQSGAFAQFADLVPTLTPNVRWENWYASADSTPIFEQSIENGINLLVAGTFLAIFNLRINNINSGDVAEVPLPVEFSIGGEIRHTVAMSWSSHTGGFFIGDGNLNISFSTIVRLTRGTVPVSVDLHWNSGDCFADFMSLQLARI